jgi:hypothetical protein
VRAAGIAQRKSPVRGAFRGLAGYAVGLGSRSEAMQVREWLARLRVTDFDAGMRRIESARRDVAEAEADGEGERREDDDGSAGLRLPGAAFRFEAAQEAA